MKILTFSDFHLEFRPGWTLPPEADGDVLLLAGDIVTMDRLDPLEALLQNWRKPVLYVPGNHEYYTARPMEEEEARLRGWLAARLPHVTLLLDEATTLDGVHFFGGTMWTDFAGGDRKAMSIAAAGMNDFRQICFDGRRFQPQDSILLHQRFVSRLQAWFESCPKGPRVVMTHHAPVVHPLTWYAASPLVPAFHSLDMLAWIEAHQPDLWVYGHTHECDDQWVGRTRILSNQLGYPLHGGGSECAGFDPSGCAWEPRLSSAAEADSVAVREDGGEPTHR